MEPRNHGSITVDVSTKTMRVKKGWFNNEMVFDMDGWTGRYGMSLEFLLSLHLATMAPELVTTMARSFDTEVQVYLDEFDGAKVTAYFSNDNSHYKDLDHFQIDPFPLVIDNAKGVTIMKDIGLESKKEGPFTCKYAEDPAIITFNGTETSGKNLSDVTTAHSGFLEVIRVGLITGWIKAEFEELYNIGVKIRNTFERTLVLPPTKDSLSAAVELAGLIKDALLWVPKFVTGELKGTIETAIETLGKGGSLDEFKDALQEEHQDPEIVKAINESTDWNNYLSRTKNGLNTANFNTIIKNMNDTITYLKGKYPDYQFDVQEVGADGAVIEVAKSITEFSKVYSKDDLEDILPFSTLRTVVSNGDAVQGEVCSFHSPDADVGDQKVIRVLLLVCQTEVDTNYDFAVVSYQEKSPNEMGSVDETCSEHIDEIDKVCSSCEQYLEHIRDSMYKIQDGNFKSYIPYIARVIGSWFRDTYFVVPETPDQAIEDAYTDRPSDYGTGKMELTLGDVEYVNVDTEYLKETDEYWTKYESTTDADGNIKYILYELYDNGTVSSTPYSGTVEEAEAAGIQLVKKPKTNTITGSGVWKAYSKGSTDKDEKILLEVDSGTDYKIRQTTYFNHYGDDTFDKILYYTMEDVPEIKQTEDARRGITNSKIKKMFKIRKYYIYDGTEEKAKLIYDDWQDILSSEGDRCLGVYETDPEFKRLYENNAGKKERAVEWAIDEYYYEGTGPFSSGDPRDPDLIGNITINKDTLNAFSILENTNTLDSDYQYRDFKELIVELNYFDKEDLSDKAEEVFTWIMPDYNSVWPVRLIDKSKEYYGTTIHLDETIQNKLKTAERADAARPEDIEQLEAAVGYAVGSDVVSPVTGKVINYGTYRRINTDLVQYEGLTPEEAKEEVGFIQIEVLKSDDIFNSSNVPGTTPTDGIENYKALNAYYEEYKDVCEGYIVTIDGIDTSAFGDLAGLKSNVSSLTAITKNPEDIVVPNLADDSEEEKLMKMEIAKTETTTAVIIDGDLYIKEGTKIGKTARSTHPTNPDYSYTRLILRNEHLEIQDDIEDYFDLPDIMTMAGVPYSGSLPADGLEWIETLEGNSAADPLTAYALSDGTVTIGPGVTNWNNDIFWELGYEQYVHYEKGDNKGMIPGDTIPRAVVMDIYYTVLDRHSESVLNEFSDTGIVFSENEAMALVAFEYQFGHIPDKLKSEIVLYKSGMANSLETVWLSYVHPEYVEGTRNRRKAEYELFTTGVYKTQDDV